MKSLVLAFLFCAVAAVSASSEEYDISGEDRTITVSPSGIFLPLNDSTLLIGGLAILLIAGLAILALQIIPIGAAADQSSYDKNAYGQGYENYYDPDLAAANSPHADAALAYAYSAHNAQQQQAYRKKRAAARGFAYNLATKMSQLETAFKKFEVETEECQKFVACEAAQLRKLKRNVPVVVLVNKIFSSPGGEEKVAPHLLEAFKAGQRQHESGNQNACVELRDVCYHAHAQNQ